MPRASFYYLTPRFSIPKFFTNNEETAATFADLAYTKEKDIIVWGLDMNGDYL